MPIKESIHRKIRGLWKEEAYSILFKEENST